MPDGKKILLNQCVTRFLAQIEGRILPYRPFLFNQTFLPQSGSENADFLVKKAVVNIKATCSFAMVPPDEHAAEQWLVSDSSKGSEKSRLAIHFD